MDHIWLGKQMNTHFLPIVFYLPFFLRITYVRCGQDSTCLGILIKEEVKIEEHTQKGRKGALFHFLVASHLNEMKYFSKKLRIEPDR